MTEHRPAFAKIFLENTDIQVDMTSQKNPPANNLPPKTMNIVYTSKSFNVDYIKICKIQKYLGQSHMRKDTSTYEFVEQGIVGN
jgi:hypothetical protein